MHFPAYRPRRLREKEALRSLIRETRVTAADLVMPCFVVHGEGVKREIASMPGNFHFSIDELIKEAAELKALGVKAILLFGLPAGKDSMASEAYAEDGIIQLAVRRLKEKCPEILVITDVCLCEYMDHGHCGVVRQGRILNDESLELLARTALSHAVAGADMIAPSDMMDGRVKAIRDTLDQAGYTHLPIMSYSAKYASSFYGPFRDAASSAPSFGDRRSYQMDPANSDEAMREVRLDIEEGADIVMIKPALAYLDIIYRVKKEFGYPVAAYNVSGEFSMLKAGAEREWIDESASVLEILTSIKRAGADIIITYFAKEAAKSLLKEDKKRW
ncbi:MAG: porphobilinogen synthase [bacterium]|nr:porphobilinogen synthase [bacterium]